MKRFVIAITLTFALSVTCLAGEVHSTDAPAPQASSPVVVAIVLAIISVVSK